MVASCRVSQRKEGHDVRGSRFSGSSAWHSAFFPHRAPTFVFRIIACDTLYHRHADVSLGITLCDTLDHGHAEVSQPRTVHLMQFLGFRGSAARLLSLSPVLAHYPDGEFT